MNGTLYQRFIGSRLNLREHLAAARSILANERTFLAYQRTALTELAVAATFIRFFDHPALTVIGWLLVPASIITMLLGLVRYRRMRGLIHQLEEHAGQQDREPQAPDQ
jgi:putative membrane protein